MYNIIIIVLSILTVTTALVFAAHFLPSRNLDLEKASPYECGFDPLNSARVPFSFRFFLVAILFLLFDLEIALLFPFPQALFIFNPSYVLFVGTFFLIILLIGLIFEWTQGGLDWAE
uniref:NADH-ubiquinone oxidoreductase chain 3 n=1 Tax=Aphelasterias japonica TaxID=194597 RepID=A0A0A0VDE2_9ECHI|nr:NADH dehydrogenase subunit 3 [Aphelasterias japonica]AIW65063.1 NADH dehydrogenase subunit 3 [Aphelasterias japonica]